MTTRKYDSSSTGPSSQSSSALNQPSDPTTGIPSLSPKGSRRLFGVAGVAILLLVAVLVYKIAVPGPGSSEIVQGERLRAIQLDVLNATGESKLAQKLTDYLRRKGFDVVEMGNYRERELEKTLVVDRGGNRQAAIQVAGALGIAEEQVVEKIDKTLYLDVSVIIGKDFKTLLPFK